MRLLETLLNSLGVRRHESGREEVIATRPLAEREFLVPSMVCEGCAETIAEALNAIPGVRDVTSSVAHKRVRVRYEPPSVDAARLKEALNTIGFTTLDA